MESAVRYDFSFPPKSSSLNHSNQQQCTMPSFHHHHNHPNHQHQHHHHQQQQQQQHLQHHQHQQQHQQNNANFYNHRQNFQRQNQYNQYHNSYQNLTSTHPHHNQCSLSKSASTSLLSYAPQAPPSSSSSSLSSSSSHHNKQSNFNNNFCNNCNNKDCSSSNHHHSKRNYQMGTQTHTQTTPTNPTTPINAATTPKDANCSFTFDDLKNTLAFMDDSPLINHTSNSTTTSTQLTVIPTECTVAALSSSSSTSSSSGLSNSSCNSCNGSSASTSPNSRLDCHCSQNSSNAQKSSVLDLLIKKSPEQSTSFSQFNNFYTPQASSSSSGGLLTTTASNGSINTAIETAAKKYRSAAQISEATCCWKGKLPAKQYKTPIVYSTKVFVGGLPWDITEDDLIKEFGLFGPCRVEWTNKEKYNLLGTSAAAVAAAAAAAASSHADCDTQSSSTSNYSRRSLGSQNNSKNEQKQRSSPGFAYVIYDSEYSVRSLVGNCIEDYQHGRDRVEYYFKISTRRVRNKEVQIIPWILADNNFALCTPKELDPKKTVFVGNLHGTMTARDLAHIMNELFGCVVYAGIDIDKLKYPIGSGRVTFSHQQNFMRAVRAAFVDIQSSKFSKRIQIDPYLEDVQCCLCYNDKGIYFCRDFQCFNYYCGACWDKQHSYNQQLGNHKPLMRKREEK